MTPELGIYRHFKGNIYELIGIAKHSETREDMAVYRALYGDGGLWVRPLDMFMAMVETDKGPAQRFVLVKNAAR